MLRRPRIWALLLVCNLVLLALPLTGVWLLRIYESALIRQTESELIAQAAMLAASFRVAWLDAGGQVQLEAMPAARSPVELVVFSPGQRPWPPWSAVLDLSDDPILTPPAEAIAPTRAADPFALAAGRLLQPVLREAQTVTLAGIRMVDSTGIVIASTGGEMGASLAAQHEIAAALAGAAVSTLRERIPEGEPAPLHSISRNSPLRVFVALPALENGRVLGAVMVSRTPRSLAQALYGKRLHLAVLALTLVGGGALIAWIIALMVSRPVRAVMLQARRVASGERGAVAPLSGPMPREIADLSDSIVSMAATLERRADYIRGFAAEISHEFKTPLTSLHGTIEILRDHLMQMSAAERRQFLDNLQADVDRLNKLVRRLLDLARADMRRRSGEERTQLHELLPMLVRHYRDQGLDLAIDAGPSAAVAIDPDSLQVVLDNLIENVRQHAGPGAKARLSWRLDKGMVLVRLADDGLGISAGNAGRIFDRFFTTARERGGTGLGLAIARSQLAAFGGSIALVPSERGATFEIALSLARDLHSDRT